MMDIVNVSPLAAMPAAATPGARPSHLVQEFETLFVETLLQHAGLAKALDTQEGSESGLFGELMLRELARGLAGQLHLGLGAALGVSASDRR
jgi:hypothetical protein